MSRDMSTADRFIAIMADIARMDHDLPEDAEERYAVWKMKDAAEAIIVDSIYAARRYVDAAVAIRLAAKDIRKAAAEQAQEEK